MRERLLGGLQVSCLGLGCMGLSGFYRAPDARAARRTVARALDLGVTLLDTAPSYGAPRLGEAANEALVGAAVRGRRDEVVLATKAGLVRQGGRRVVDNSPAHLRASVDASLARLGTDRIDLLHLYRRDPAVPLAEVVGTLGELVRAGKVRALGLCEVDAATLREACAVHPVAAVQSEWSLLSRQLEDEVLPAATALGVAVVAYAPLGRALLTGTVSSLAATRPADLRRTQPRFSGDNLPRNLALVDALRPVAADIGCTPAQLALAWLLARSPAVVPIPSTLRVRHLEEDVAAAGLVLTPEQVAAVEAAVPAGRVAGARNTPEALALLHP